MTLRLRYPTLDDEKIARALHDQLLAHDGFEFLLVQGPGMKSLKLSEAKHAAKIYRKGGSQPTSFWLKSMAKLSVGCPSGTPSMTTS